jgi:hypothetical protein
MSFLLAAMRRSARRIQLQQWLLLAARTLVIVLVVLAVAEPYGEGLIAGGPLGAPAHKVVVVDASYSMAYRSGDLRRIDRAKQLAGQLVRESGGADTFTLIQLADPPQTILGRDVIDRSAVVAQIDALPLAHTGGDLARTLGLVEKAISGEPDAEETRQLENSASPIERHEVYFFTDLQRASWGSRSTESPARNDEAITDAENDAIRESLRFLAQRATLMVIDVDSATADNLAVTHLAAADPFVTTRGETGFEATLHQFGAQARSRCAVELIVDGMPVAEQSVDVPAGGDAAVRFTHHFRAPGYHTLAIRAAGDALEIDNTRWLVVPVRDEVKVLCVAGKAGAAKYVASALDPDPTDLSPLRPVVINEGDLAEVELAEFDCVIFCNVARLSVGEAERIKRYSSAGGGMIVFLGDRVRAEAWEQGDEKQSDAPSLLPARIGELIAEPQFGLDPLEYRHPIVAAFRGRERAGLLTTPVARYFRLHLSDDRPDAEVAARLTSGDPFLITAPLGRGRVVLVATDGSLSSVDAATGEPWTAWPAWPSFLPLVREMLAYAVAGQREQWQLPVGAALASNDRDSAPLSGVVHITRPDGRTDSLQPESDSAGQRWSYDATDMSGIYSVRVTENAEPQPFAVNVDTRESDLAAIDRQQIPAEISVRTTPQEAAGPAGSDMFTKAGWQQPLLAGALALLLVESLMAWHFGRGLA